MKYVHGVFAVVNKIMLTIILYFTLFVCFLKTQFLYNAPFTVYVMHVLAMYNVL
jgi:hypothetical protein